MAFVPLFGATFEDFSQNVQIKQYRRRHHLVLEEHANHLKEHFLQLLSDPRYLQKCCDIACCDYCYHFQCKNHHTGMQPLTVKTSTNPTTVYSLHTRMLLAVMASFKRQPEKKDALLMRRRGPCSEKARRGLHS